MLISNSAGIEQKYFNATIDRYLMERTMDQEIYAKMSLYQKSVIQEIKKSLKRIEKKYEDISIHH